MFFYSLITLYFLSKFLFFFKFKKTSLFNSPMFNAFLDTSIIINVLNYNKEFFNQFDIFIPIISLFNKDIEFLNNILYFTYILISFYFLFNLFIILKIRKHIQLNTHPLQKKFMKNIFTFSLKNRKIKIKNYISSYLFINENDNFLIVSNDFQNQKEFKKIDKKLYYKKNITEVLNSTLLNSIFFKYNFFFIVDKKNKCIFSLNEEDLKILPDITDISELTEEHYSIIEMISV